MVPDIELIRPIGEGGFGQVWLGRNQTTGQLRAVKVITLGGAPARDRAGREITSLTRLEANLRRQHPNLLTIHHVGKTDQCLFYVMDPADDLDGGPATTRESYRPATLAHLLARGPLESSQCGPYADQLLSGLAWLHQAGMVHRDIKPANCLLVDGQLKVADFGLLTHAGPQVSRLGTEKYMPPDGRMDARADVYAAGLVIYEMVTGMPVERFPQLGDRARDVVDDPVLCRLIRLVMEAGQPDPQRRPPDAAAMRKQLSERGSDAIEAASASRRRWLLAAASVGLVSVLGGASFWLTWPARVHVNFTTYPFEAMVILDGTPQTTPDRRPYTTPCTIDGLPARPHHVVFRLSGRPDLDLGEIDFAKSRQVEAQWETE
jgi:serine/threonine protein kinase